MLRHLHQLTAPLLLLIVATLLLLRSRRWRVSLREMMIAITVIAIVLGWAIYEAGK